MKTTSLDMTALVARAKSRRGPACLDARGVYNATPEAAQWHNKLAAMREAGSTAEDMRAALEADRQALRALGHNI